MNGDAGKQTVEPVTPGKRPTAVPVIAWTAIVGGALMLLAGIMGAAMFSFLKAMGGGEFPPGMETAPGQFRFMAGLFRNFDRIAYAQAVLAGCIIVAGAYFLRLRAWARTFLESVCWLGIVYSIVFGTYWVFSWNDMSVSLSASGQVPDLSGMFGIFGTVVGAVVVLINAAPLAVAVWFLRSSKVREAVS